MASRLNPLSNQEIDKDKLLAKAIKPGFVPNHKARLNETAIVNQRKSPSSSPNAKNQRKSRVNYRQKYLPRVSNGTFEEAKEEEYSHSHSHCADDEPILESCNHTDMFKDFYFVSQVCQC